MMLRLKDQSDGSSEEADAVWNKKSNIMQIITRPAMLDTL
jgi:hypothetical protein